MEHVVFFPAPDGTPAFRRFAGLEDAVRFVEHLRNVENVSSASVYSLTEVPLSFKAWYHVELPDGEQIAPASQDAPASEPAQSASSEPSVGEPEPVQVQPATAQEAPRPVTIAEVAATYAPGGPDAGQVDIGDGGSNTGIVVPDQPLVAVDQFTMPPVPSVPPPSAPIAVPAAPAAQVAAEQPVAVPRVEGETVSDAQVLEPAFGSRRERGLGFFSR